LDKAGNVPSAQQAEGGVGEVEGLVSDNSKGAVVSRPVLTAAERAAVARGIQELENPFGINAPRLLAPRRPVLTDEEKAAVARGLRELEKGVGQAKQ
jgi:hypothetical protein